MKKIFTLLILFLFSGCVSNAGVIYNNVTTPIIATDMKVDNIKNLKMGEVHIYHYLYLWDIGDAGIQKAAIRGGITQIHHVDVKKRTFLGIGLSTIRVYGE